MNKLPFITGAFVIVSVAVFAQRYEKELTPSRGHYKELVQFDPKKKANEAIDQQRFPYNEASAERAAKLKPYYLEGVSLNDFRIPEPPANSSEQTRAELNYLLLLQQQRTSLDIESSLYMAGVYYNVNIKPEDSSYHAYRKNLFHIGRSMGTWFTPENLPLTADLMANVWRDASYFIWGYKYKFLRVRPYVLEPSLKNLEDTNWAAYPSGHAANSYINAYIYQELAPHFGDLFIKDAYDMAHSREIIGVHYPSDSEASRVLARQLVNKLFQNQKFLRDFEAVKKEWQEKARESFQRPAVIQVQDIKPNTSSCARKCQ